MTDATTLQQATFGGGCFWCTEAVFQQLKGVTSVVSGYAGGLVPNPTYEQISTGSTGHAEVIQITFDPAVIAYSDLLAVFFATHDPTTFNQQGHDIGTQYRSVIFHHDEQQLHWAEQFVGDLDVSGEFAGPLVTQISPLPDFYPAEKYHQNYFQQNPDQPYCHAVIRPKLEKLSRLFSEKLGE